MVWIEQKYNRNKWDIQNFPFEKLAIFKWMISCYRNNGGKYSELDNFSN